MTFPYEEFDLSGVSTYPLKSRRSKTRAEDFARPYAGGSGLAAFARQPAAHPGRSRLRRHRRRDPRRAGEARRHRVGSRRARGQDRPVAGPHRPDGARVRLGDRDQRRRDHPRLRGRPGRRDLRGRRRVARPGPVRHGGGDRPAAEPRDQRRRRVGPGHRTGRRRRSSPGTTRSSSGRASRPPRHDSGSP